MADVEQAREESADHEGQNVKQQSGRRGRGGGDEGGVSGSAMAATQGDKQPQQQQDERKKKEEEEEQQQQQQHEQRQQQEQEQQLDAGNGSFERGQRTNGSDQHLSLGVGENRFHRSEDDEGGSGNGAQVSGPGSLPPEYGQCDREGEEERPGDGPSNLTTALSGSTPASGSTSTTASGEAGSEEPARVDWDASAATAEEQQGEGAHAGDDVWDETIATNSLAAHEAEPVHPPATPPSNQPTRTGDDHCSSPDKPQSAADVTVNRAHAEEREPSATAAVQQAGQQPVQSPPGTPSKAISGDDDDIWIVDESGASRFDEDHFLRILHSTDSALARMQQASMKQKKQARKPSQPTQGAKTQHRHNQQQQQQQQQQQPQQHEHNLHGTTGSAPASAAASAHAKLPGQRNVRHETPPSHHTSFRAASITSSREKHRPRQRQHETSFQHSRHDHSHGGTGERQTPGSSAPSRWAGGTAAQASRPQQQQERAQEQHRQQQQTHKLQAHKQQTHKQQAHKQQQRRGPTPRRRPSMTRQELQSTSHMSETQVMALLEQSDHILSYLHTINTSTPPGAGPQSAVSTTRGGSFHSVHTTTPSTASSMRDSQHHSLAHRSVQQRQQQQESSAFNMSASSFALSSPANLHNLDHDLPHGGAVSTASSSSPRRGRRAKGAARGRDTSPSFAARLQAVTSSGGQRSQGGYDSPDHYHHHNRRRPAGHHLPARAISPSGHSGGSGQGTGARSPQFNDGSFISPGAFAIDVDTSAAVQSVPSRSPRHARHAGGAGDAITTAAAAARSSSSSMALSPESAAAMVTRQHSDVTHDRGSPRLVDAGHTPPLRRKRDQTSPLHLVSLARDAIAGSTASESDTLPPSLAFGASPDTNGTTDKQRVRAAAPATASSALSPDMSASPQHMAELSRQLTTLRNETNPVLLQALADIPIEDLTSAPIFPKPSELEQPRTAHAPSAADAVLQWCTKLDLHRVRRRPSSAPNGDSGSRELIVTDVQPHHATQLSAAVRGARGPASVLPDDRDVSLSQDRLLQGEQWSHYDCLMHPSHEPALARLIRLLPCAEDMEACLPDTMCDAVLMRRPNEKRAKREKDATFCYKAAVAASMAAAAAAAEAHGSTRGAGHGDAEERQRASGGSSGESVGQGNATGPAGEIDADRGEATRSDGRGGTEQGVGRSQGKTGDVHVPTSAGDVVHNKAEKAEERVEGEVTEKEDSGKASQDDNGKDGDQQQRLEERQELGERSVPAHAGEEEEEEEIDGEDEPASALGVLAGALITMIDSFPDHVTGDMPLGNTQVLEGTAVHVAYVYLDNDYVLAVSCAGSLCSFSHLQQHVASLVDTLKALYSDTQALLVSRRHQRLLVAHLTRFFAHLLDSCVRGSTGYTSIYNHPISLNTSCMKVPLPVKISADVEAAVSGLAVCAGSCNLPRRNAALCRGAALLYKAHTVHATLAPPEARAVLAVCRHIGLFDHLARSDGGVAAFVFWHPLHVDTWDAKDGTRSLLVVASGPAAVCMLLQSAPHTGLSTGIDRVHVDRANLCLHALDAGGTLRQLDEFFKSPGLVKTAAPSQEHPGIKTYDSQSSFAESLPSGSPRKDAPSFYSAPGEMQSSPQTVLYDEAVQRRLTIAGVRRRPRVIQKALHLPSLEPGDPRAMVASGRGNAVFHFLATEPHTGLVFVSDPPHDRVLAAHSLQAHVFSQFHQAARRLRTQLHRHGHSSAPSATATTRASGMAVSAQRDPAFANASALSNMEEHGLMFTIDVSGHTVGTQGSSGSSSQDAMASGACNPALGAFQRRRSNKKGWNRHGEAQAGHVGTLSPLSYWVVGRLLPPRSHKTHSRPQQQHQQQQQDCGYREVYVCFRDGAGQSMADMAFKLFTGL